MCLFAGSLKALKECIGGEPLRNMQNVAGFEGRLVSCRGF